MYVLVIVFYLLVCLACFQMLIYVPRLFLGVVRCFSIFSSFFPPGLSAVRPETPDWVGQSVVSVPINHSINQSFNQLFNHSTSHSNNRVSNASDGAIQLKRLRLKTLSPGNLVPQACGARNRGRRTMETKTRIGAYHAALINGTDTNAREMFHPSNRC